MHSSCTWIFSHSGQQWSDLFCFKSYSCIKWLHINNFAQQHQRSRVLFLLSFPFCKFFRIRIMLQLLIHEKSSVHKVFGLQHLFADMSNMIQINLFVRTIKALPYNTFESPSSFYPLSRLMPLFSYCQRIFSKFFCWIGWVHLFQVHHHRYMNVCRDCSFGNWDDMIALPSNFMLKVCFFPPPICTSIAHLKACHQLLKKKRLF